MSFRIRQSNLEAVRKLFPDLQVVPPKRGLHGGCSDPGHCPQHPGVIEDETAVGVSIPGISGREFHRRLVAAGIIPVDS